MGLNNLFTKRKGEKKFFSTYIKQATVAQTAATYLKNLVSTEDIEDRKSLARLIKKQETTGDELLRNFYVELNETFVTPFDREDMNTLAMAFDKFIDFINHAAKTTMMYNPKRIDRQICEIIDHIVEDANIIVEVSNNLEELGKRQQLLLDLCQKVVHIEHLVDDIYGEYISYIFENEKNEIELLKYKEISQVVEDATDRGKDIADTIRGIILKQS